MAWSSTRGIRLAAPWYYGLIATLFWGLVWAIALPRMMTALKGFLIGPGNSHHGTGEIQKLGSVPSITTSRAGRS
jgi:hypothetical protein